MLTDVLRAADVSVVLGNAPTWRRNKKEGLYIKLSFPQTQTFRQIGTHTTHTHTYTHSHIHSHSHTLTLTLTYLHTTLTFKDKHEMYFIIKNCRHLFSS